jgi:hypothetical protein
VTPDPSQEQPTCRTSGGQCRRPSSQPRPPDPPEVVRARARLARKARRQATREARRRSYQSVAHGRRGRPPSLLEELLDDLPGWAMLALVVAGIVVWALLGR